MVNTSNFSRFRVNPVELIIFSAVAVIGLNSLYRLFYDQQGFLEQPVAEISKPAATEGRAPASISASFVNMDTNCDPVSTLGTGASKARLNGPLCGSLEKDGAKLSKALITNHANQFNATVFTDVVSGKYSTDYIPLNPGANTIRIEFVYQDGQTVSQNLTINRN